MPFAINQFHALLESSFDFLYLQLHPSVFLLHRIDVHMLNKSQKYVRYGRVLDLFVVLSHI